jgi:hypothetical protein
MPTHRRTSEKALTPMGNWSEAQMRTKTPRINRLAQLVRFLRISRLLLRFGWIDYVEGLSEELMS